MVYKIKSNDELILLRRSLDMLNCVGICKESIDFVLSYLIPKDEKGINLFDYHVKDWGMINGVYYPSYDPLTVVVEKCQEWVLNNGDDLAKLYKVDRTVLFRNYLGIFYLVNEIERANQYLMGKGTIEAPCKLVQGGYKTLCELLVKPNTMIPHPIKDIRKMISLIQYYKKHEKYVLERNSSILAFDAVFQLASFNSDKEMMEVFADLVRTYLSVGYEKDVKGSFYHTFKDLYLMREYNKMNVTDGLTMKQRVLYGLDIDEKTREEVLMDVKRRTF